MTPDQARALLRGRGWSDIAISATIRDEFRCVYCEFDGSTDYRAFWQLTTEHVLPSSRLMLPPDLQDGIENTVTACFRCNCKRGNWLPCGAPQEHLRDASREDQLQAIQDTLGIIKADLAPFRAADREEFEAFKWLKG